MKGGKEGQHRKKLQYHPPPAPYRSYYVWTRWGRVGEPGQNAMKYTSSVADAQKEFKKKFSDKTKNSWDKRHNFTPVPGKYTLLEMDDDSEDEEVCTPTARCL